LPPRSPVTLTIVGAALDPALGRAARDLAAADSRVQWLGPRAHAWTRQAIKRAHLLVVPSRMEGGANVVVEAVTSGTPIVASRISGNVGMLGASYPGYFAPADAKDLASLVARIQEDRGLLATLEAHCREQEQRFAPEAEARALRNVVGEALRAKMHA
jgi:glycosyltransferase involved in cell wall biosynthesis